MDTSAGRTPYEARPLIGLISDLWRETSRLIHAEVELATVEISEKVSEIRTGLVAIAKGRSELKAANLAPERTLRSLQRDAQLVKGHIR